MRTLTNLYNSIYILNPCASSELWLYPEHPPFRGAHDSLPAIPPARANASMEKCRTPVAPHMCTANYLLDALEAALDLDLRVLLVLLSELALPMEFVSIKSSGRDEYHLLALVYSSL